MENDSFRPGSRLGALLLSVGLLITGINAAMIGFSGSYHPKFFVLGLWLVLLSVVFFVFRGGPVSENPLLRKLGRTAWQHAPRPHRTAWIVWGILSGIASLYALTQFDPDFWP